MDSDKKILEGVSGMRTMLDEITVIHENNASRFSWSLLSEMFKSLDRLKASARRLEAHANTMQGGQESIEQIQAAISSLETALDDFHDVIDMHSIGGQS